MGKINGKTKSGFTYSINDNLTDDWDFLESMANLSETNSSYAEIRVAEHLLDKDQLKKLKDHCKEEDGHISFKRMDEEIGEILAVIYSKNS